MLVIRASAIGPGPPMMGSCPVNRHEKGAEGYDWQATLVSRGNICDSDREVIVVRKGGSLKEESVCYA